MNFSWTLFRYLSVQFLRGVGMILSIILALVFLIDLVEALRNFSSKHGVAFSTVLSMVILKLPYLMLQVLPFAFLFGAIYSLTRQTRTNELIVVRAAGVSVWQFLAPALLNAFVIGVLCVTVINPVSSELYSRFKTMSARYLGGPQSQLHITEEGFWLRQGDGKTQSIVHAVNADKNGTRLGNVTIQVYENLHSWKRRIDASDAVLEHGYWLMHKAQVTEPGHPPRIEATLKVPTSLTQTQIEDSFAPPDTLSFWALPRFIRLTEAAGFSALPHRMHWHSILSLPVLLCAMVLIAATVSLRLTRLGGVSRLVLLGGAAGFALYFTSDVTQALGMAGTLPVVLAAWAPTLIALLLGLTSLLYLEDG